MSITKYLIVSEESNDKLERRVLALATGPDAYVPYGPAIFSDRKWHQTLVVGGVAAGTGSIAAADITDATAIGIGLITADNQAEGRAVIGAGTSNLVLGTTAGTAKEGDYQPAAADITDATATGEALVTAANPAAARTTLELGTLSTADLNAAIAFLGLQDLAFLDTITADKISDSDAFGRSILAAINAAQVRNIIELGQLATLNEVAAAQISDNTITNTEISPAANIALSKLAGVTAVGTAVATAASEQAGRTAIGMPQQAAIADIGIAPTAADYNAILTVLRAVGIIAP